MQEKSPHAREKSVRKRPHQWRNFYVWRTQGQKGTPIYASHEAAGRRRSLACLRSLKPVTVSAGEIAERGSFVDLGDVRNPRTDLKHGCISANASRFRVEFGGKPRMVCVQGPPGLHVFLLDKWGDIRRNNVENRWNVKRVPWNAKKRTRVRFGHFEGSPNRKLTLLDKGI